jgi:hypothetical protein
MNAKSTPQIDLGKKLLRSQILPWKNVAFARRGCVAFKAVVMLYLAAQ